MKNILYMLFIVSLAATFVLCTDKLVTSTYHIQKDIVETTKFRIMNIDTKTISNAEEFSKKNNYDISRVLSAAYIYDNCRLSNKKFKIKTYENLNSGYFAADCEEYSKVSKAMSAVFDDIRYFPVAKSLTSDYWVQYEDSFFADRNYNGEYKHEGTDIMAENNVSGFYPVVSMTDGVVENIGWLEKGGYRIGIRGKSGGYFYYAHLSSYSDIKKGDNVKAGTLLGYMGDTGYGKAEGTAGNFAVHLHLGIYIKTQNYNELSINPYNILKYLENKLIIADY